MRVLIALLLVSAVFVGVRAQDSEDDPEALRIINKIENSKFGKTLLDTIQLQLAAGDPVSDLIKMLNDIEKNLEDEQDEDDKYIFGLQDECDQEISRLTDEIEAATARAKELGDELNSKIPLRDQKVRESKEKSDFLAAIKQEIDVLDAKKDLKDQEWAQEQEEHQKAQYAIERAREIIVNSLKSKGSFLQEPAKVGSVLAQVSQHLAKQVKSYQFKRKSWNRIFSMLASIAQAPGVQADSSAVDKIVALCDEIIDKISESREIERRDYNHWIDEYSNTRQGLVERAEQTQNEIDDLEQQISILNKRITLATQEKKEQEDRVRDKTQQRSDKTQWCDDENVAYGERRQQRDDDREVVSDAIALFNAQIRTFRKYVSSRVGSIQKSAF